MFEELFNLLCQLGLGPAARPACDLLTRLAGESMSLRHLREEIRNVLADHGRAHLTSTVLSALVELGLADLSPALADESNEDAGAAADAPATRAGYSQIADSLLLADSRDAIAINPRAVRSVRETARGWLDIDGGIYIDVRQHGAGSDSEK